MQWNLLPAHLKWLTRVRFKASWWYSECKMLNSDFVPMSVQLHYPGLCWSSLCQWAPSGLDLGPQPQTAKISACSGSFPFDHLSQSFTSSVLRQFPASFHPLLFFCVLAPFGVLVQFCRLPLPKVLILVLISMPIAPAPLEAEHFSINDVCWFHLMNDAHSIFMTTLAFSQCLIWETLEVKLKKEYSSVIWLWVWVATTAGNNF